MIQAPSLNFVIAEYDHHDESANGAETIDDHLALPMPVVHNHRSRFDNFLALFETPRFPPAAGHAGL